MTPERQKWWDSLPKEERLVRLAIKKEKQYYKSYECPRCREGAITYLPHCSMCGQKLRW